MLRNYLQQNKTNRHDNRLNQELEVDKKKKKKGKSNSQNNSIKLIIKCNKIKNQQLQGQNMHLEIHKHDSTSFAVYEEIIMEMFNTCK